MLGRVRSSRFLKNQSGAAAAEIAIWGVLLVVPIASAADLGVYVVQDMQVKMAAQAGAQAARKTCWNKVAPLSTTCSGMTSAVTAGIQSTALGSGVTLAANYPKEGYYCPNADEELTLVEGSASEGYPGAPPSKPNPYNCNDVTSGNVGYPGVYVKVMVNYPYTPLFSSVSVAGMLPATITKTAWIRML